MDVHGQVSYPNPLQRTQLAGVVSGLELWSCSSFPSLVLRGEAGHPRGVSLSKRASHGWKFSTHSVIQRGEGVASLGARLNDFVCPATGDRVRNIQIIIFSQRYVASTGT